MRLSRRRFLERGARACAVAGVCLGTADCGVAGGRRVAATVWGGPGRRRGEFQRPRAIAAYKGEVYVIDTSGRVQVFTAEGEYTRGWSTPDYRNGTPTGLAFGADDRVIIPDTHYSRILEYDPEGNLLESWGAYGTGPDEFIYPTDVALGTDGAYYISEYGMGADRIHVFDGDRRFLRQWGENGEEPGRMNRAMGIELDRAGVLYVADTANHRIQRFDTEGACLGVFGGMGAEPGCTQFPFQIALAPDGTLLVCEYGMHRISRFTSEGRFIACTGAPGRKPGEFNGPRGVAVSDEGRVYVADTDNHRVQCFDLEALA